MYKIQEIIKLLFDVIVDAMKFEFKGLFDESTNY